MGIDKSCSNPQKTILKENMFAALVQMLIFNEVIIEIDLENDSHERDGSEGEKFGMNL